MTDERNDTAAQTANARRAAQLVALLLVAACVALVVGLGSRAASARAGVVANDNEGRSLEASAPPPSEQTEWSRIDFSKFGHTNPSHARLPCLLCHRRENNSIVPVRSLGHTPCAGCHQQQFNDTRSPICTICHTEVGSAKPPLKPFPSLKTFGLRFDHAGHARNATSCALCHKPAGRGSVAQSIPAGLDAHATCFTCHDPRATAPTGQDISSCGNCHRIGGYARTPVMTRAYSTTPFSHAAHTRKGLSCAECHQTRAGAPLARQVSAPTPSQHHAPAGTRSCASCHDNKRAFGGDDFTDCARCHKGNQWRF